MALGIQYYSLTELEQHFYIQYNIYRFRFECRLPSTKGNKILEIDQQTKHYEHNYISGTLTYVNLPQQLSHGTRV